MLREEWNLFAAGTAPCGPTVDVDATATVVTQMVDVAERVGEGEVGSHGATFVALDGIHLVLIVIDDRCVLTGIFTERLPEAVNIGVVLAIAERFAGAVVKQSVFHLRVGDVQLHHCDVFQSVVGEVVSPRLVVVAFKMVADEALRQIDEQSRSVIGIDTVLQGFKFFTVSWQQPDVEVEFSQVVEMTVWCAHLLGQLFQGASHSVVSCFERVQFLLRCQMHLVIFLEGEKEIVVISFVDLALPRKISNSSFVLYRFYLSFNVHLSIFNR